MDWSIFTPDTSENTAAARPRAVCSCCANERIKQIMPITSFSSRTINVFQTKLGFSKVAFYPQNLKKKRNYADKSHFWLKKLIFVEKP